MPAGTSNSSRVFGGSVRLETMKSPPGQMSRVTSSNWSVSFFHRTRSFFNSLSCFLTVPFTSLYIFGSFVASHWTLRGSPWSIRFPCRLRPGILSASKSLRNWTDSGFHGRVPGTAEGLRIAWTCCPCVVQTVPVKRFVTRQPVASRHCLPHCYRHEGVEM